jgi:mannose-1-phosphate guanylyltransferase
MNKLKCLFVGVSMIGIFIIGYRPVLSAVITKQGIMTVTVNLENIQGKPETKTLVMKVYKESVPTVAIYTLSVTASGKFDVPITMSANDNEIITERYYATATDISGNISEKSNIVTVTVEGNDTLPPKPPVCGQITWNN